MQILLINFALNNGRFFPLNSLLFLCTDLYDIRTRNYPCNRILM